MGAGNIVMHDLVSAHDKWHLWSPFLKFSKRQLETKDYDPFHPMLWNLQKDADDESALWGSVLYMAFYSMGSAYQAWVTTDPLQVPPEESDKWHIGVQRRNLRASSVRAHLEDFSKKAKEHGGIRNFLTADFCGDPESDWEKLILQVESVWGNGRWAAYTTSELFQKVNNIPVVPSNLGMHGATGPRAGICRLVPKPKNTDVSVLEWLGGSLTKELKFRFPDPQIPWAKSGVDKAMVESLLCDFNSLAKGRYYIGRDIDRIAGRIVDQEKKTGFDMLPLWECREKSFAPYLLTEKRGVTTVGVDWDRAKMFLNHNAIVDYADDFMLMV